MNNKTTNVWYLAQLALLAAIEVVMKLMGLGSVPVGPLYMSFPDRADRCRRDDHSPDRRCDSSAAYSVWSA